MELEKISKEIEEIVRDKYLSDTALERQLHQELSEKITIQKEEIEQNMRKLEEIEKNLRNKETVLQKYIKVKESLCTC